MRRALDYALATCLLLLSTPLLAVMLAVCWLETGSPLFTQTRLGIHEKHFRIIKLRTMKPGTPNKESHLIAPDALTFTGKLLRKLKLDELPQLINVIRGEMSIVGPRPCLPSQSNLVALRRKAKIFDVLPGITGVAQLSKVDMSQPERLTILDLETIETRTITKYLGLILRTFTGRGTNDTLQRTPLK